MIGRIQYGGMSTVASLNGNLFLNAGATGLGLGAEHFITKKAIIIKNGKESVQKFRP